MELGQDSPVQLIPYNKQVGSAASKRTPALDFADPTIADAIPDRIVHNARSIELNGESLRKRLQPALDNEHPLINFFFIFIQSNPA
jgi:hypothetical protein